MKKKKTTKKKKGFTLIELLIVIVVIGILVAIVVVAYMGITQNARNTGYKANASSIQKVADTANSQAGQYPQTVAAISSGQYSKLPADVGVVLVTTGTITNTSLTQAGAPTTTGAQTWAMYTDSSTNKKYYSVRACGASVGLNVYYPQDGGSLGTMKVGSGC